MAEVYIDEFTFHSDFNAAWRKLCKYYLGEVAKDTLAAELESTIHTKYVGPIRDICLKVMWSDRT